MEPKRLSGCERRERCYLEKGASPDGSGVEGLLSHRRELGSLLSLLSVRLAALLDPGSPFLEFSSLAAHEVYGDDKIPGAGMITGIGRVSGRECVVVVNDPTVKGGAYYPLTVSELVPRFDVAVLI